ncbi:FMN reductase (NADPH) [Paenibacillus sp. 1_12]|uniref:oxygen-insensitive NADPH nitroreductase n=1 Tax=Paenibacillus sp. 1_12 TaxID=1566278 RepID=UPI0008E20D4A|nr:oxygen-insensitive NADPH nitroreductase [Paenibacillus sp. 1_12]SFL21658.1 FMN reductase (NADPH) [Paenibacillus sp. 1_12]
MNSTISQLQQHRSIRKYKSDPLTDEQLKTIIQSAQSAPTSSNMQAYSVIAVTNPGTKSELAKLAANQSYIEECPVFLVWCADLHRLQHAASAVDDVQIPNTTEIFIIATVDAALAAQNATLAAESLGLGAVYIGGIRDNIRKVSDLLRLPKLVYPVFGMCVGYPDQEPSYRPRLPLETILHREHYSTDSYDEGIEQYNWSLQAFMATRVGGNRDTNWSKEVAKRLKSKKRDDVTQFLHDQGFELK